MFELQRSRPETCLSDLELDRLQVGELEGEHVTIAREHIQSCDACRGRWKEIVTQGADLPPLERPSQARLKWGGATAAVAVAAAVLMVVWPKDDAVDTVVPAVAETPSPDTGTRAKGSGFSLTWFTQRQGVAVSADQVDALHPADVLVFQYSSNTAGYLAVFGRDGAGVVTPYFPEGTAAARLPAAREAAFGGGIELDETLGEEAAFGFWCETAVPMSTLQAAVQDAELQPLAPPGCAVQSLRTVKRALP